MGSMRETRPRAEAKVAEQKLQSSQQSADEIVFGRLLFSPQHSVNSRRQNTALSHVEFHP
jgi:hypothetical protein